MIWFVIGYGLLIIAIVLGGVLFLDKMLRANDEWERDR